MNNTLKIALIGYGKMGQLIRSYVPQNQIEVVTTYNSESPLDSSEKNRHLLQNVDVLVDFSSPSAVLENIYVGAELGKNMVIGTTGWYNRIEEVKSIVAETGIGFIFASNFSLGINLMFKIIDYASNLFKAFNTYNPKIEEIHHKLKKDSPSGTAVKIKRILNNIYKDVEIPIHSIRAGYIPGTHTVNFDSEIDTIKIKHTAKNRQGFLEGTLLAINWIYKRSGFYEFSDVLDDILNN